MARPFGQGEKTKQHIAKEGRVLFERQGYAATSMDALARAAGVSKGNIYYHFKGKEDLFLYIYEASCAEWRLRWRQSVEGVTSATEKLYRLAEAYAAEAQSAIATVAAEFSIQNRSQEITDRLIEIMKDDYPVFRQLLAEGIAKGEFQEQPLDELTSIVVGFIYGLGTEIYLKGMEAYLAMQRPAIHLLLTGLQKQRENEEVKERL